MALYNELDKSVTTGALSDESKGLPWGETIRDYEPDANVVWRWGKPNYARTNKAYFRHRSMVHPEGSLEAVVTKIVKNWEVESHHIADPKQWKTMAIENFKITTNGGLTANAQVMADEGPYNLLMGELPMYSSKQHTFETSNQLWSRTFPDGFAWEVLEVLAGPPNVTFKWRHFGAFSGEFIDKDGVSHKGNGEVVEVRGLCIAKVTDSLQVEVLDIYYNPADLITPLMQNVSKDIKSINPEEGETSGGKAAACGCGKKEECSVM